MLHGAKQLNMPVIRDALKDRSLWCGLALVKKHDGEDSHFDISDDGDVILSIVVMPEGTPVHARLGSFGGGAGLGIWRIPLEGCEVAWICPHGDIEEADMMVIGTLSTGELPQDLKDDNDQMVMVHDEKIQIRSKNADVNIDADNLVNLQGGNNFVALANLVNTELGKIKTFLEGHVHPAGLLKDSLLAAVTGSTAASTSTYAKADVDAEKVKAT